MPTAIVLRVALGWETQSRTQRGHGDQQVSFHYQPTGTMQPAASQVYPLKDRMAIEVHEVVETDVQGQGSAA